ncbi:MAG: hypothetical protein QF858_02205 [Candidatus Pacebacteria bacterium]|nr:hypothetical protein [Candidatus Paceibacterota bacterium]
MAITPHSTLANHIIALPFLFILVEPVPSSEALPLRPLLLNDGTLLVRRYVILATYQLLRLGHTITCNQVSLAAIAQHVVARNREHMAALVVVVGSLLEVALVVILDNEVAIVIVQTIAVVVGYKERRKESKRGVSIRVAVVVEIPLRISVIHQVASFVNHKYSHKEHKAYKARSPLEVVAQLVVARNREHMATLAELDTLLEHMALEDSLSITLKPLLQLTLLTSHFPLIPLSPPLMSWAPHISLKRPLVAKLRNQFQHYTSCCTHESKL